jgi:hypothetical protein
MIYVDQRLSAAVFANHHGSSSPQPEQGYSQITYCRCAVVPKLCKVVPVARLETKPACSPRIRAWVCGGARQHGGIFTTCHIMQQNFKEHQNIRGTCRICQPFSGLGTPAKRLEIICYVTGARSRQLMGYRTHYGKSQGIKWQCPRPLSLSGRGGANPDVS